MKKSFIIFLKSCIGLILLMYFLLRVDLNLVVDQITRFPEDILMFISSLYLFPQLINTFKWQLFLPHHSYSSLLKMTLISHYYNLILPGQIIGESVKAYKLGKGREDAEQVAASVALDKITSFIGLLLLGIFGSILRFNIINYGILITLCIFVVVLFSCLFIFHFKSFRGYSNITLKKILVISTRTKRLGDRLGFFIDACMVYSQQTKLIFYSILVGVLVQMLLAYLNYILARQLGITVNFLDWCWIMPIATIALLLPVSIGGLGVREGSFITLLGWVGVGNERALAFSLILFFIQILFAIVGLILNLKLHFNNIRNNKSEKN